MKHEEPRLLCGDDLPLRLCLVLARSRMLVPPLLFDVLRIERRPLELRGLVHRLWQVSYPVARTSQHTGTYVPEEMFGLE